MFFESPKDTFYEAKLVRRIVQNDVIVLTIVKQDGGIGEKSRLCDVF